MKRRFYIAIDVEGEENALDALHPDTHESLCGMACWVETLLERSAGEDAVVGNATVYASPEDLFRDESQRADND